MQELLQELQLGVGRMVGREHPVRDGRPIDTAIGREHCITPASPQRRLNFWIVCEQDMAGAVGVEKAGAQLYEQLRHKRLAAGHAAD